MSGIQVEVTDSQRIDVGDGVSIPKAWDIAATGEPDVAGTIHLHVAFDHQLRRAAATSVRLDRPEEGEEVTAAALRDIRVQYLVAVSSMRVITVARDGDESERLGGDYLADVKARTDRSYEDTVREAVTIYRLASTANLAPLKLVSEHLGVSVSTATRMMARAREAGLAEDLITRDTYNRMRADERKQTGPHQFPGSSSGPSIGR